MSPLLQGQKSAIDKGKDLSDNNNNIHFILAKEDFVLKLVTISSDGRLLKTYKTSKIVVIITHRYTHIPTVISTIEIVKR